MKKHLLSMIALGVLGGLFLTGNSWSQQPATGSGKRFTTATAPSAGGAAGVEYPLSIGVVRNELNALNGMAPPLSEIEQLMIQLRDADDDAKKANVTKKLEAAVDKLFDEDLKNRETEWTKLEERLTKLRAQLDRRRKAKAEIIQLQIKVMVNEADGLGFSGASIIEGTIPSGPGRFGGAIGFPGGGATFGGPPETIGRPVNTTPPAKP